MFQSSYPGSPMNEQHLLIRVARGDQSAVAEVIDLYGGLVATLANRYCVNPADTEDAIQEIFVELWKHSARFQPAKGAEVTFVAMIARRRLVDLNRRKRERPVVDIEVDSIPTDSPGNFGGDAELVEQVDTAIEVLKLMPENQRNVILMAIYGGLSHTEVAAETDLPLGTVKTWIRQGLRKMRCELEKVNSPKLKKTRTRYQSVR